MSEKGLSLDDDNNSIGSTTQHQGTEPDHYKQNVVEELYNTIKRVNDLIKAWAGNLDEKNKKRALAGARFLYKQLGALKGIIDTRNGFSKKREEECKKILYDANRAFIYDMANERTILVTDYRTMAKTFEHAVELFLGLVAKGHGANVLRDALAGLNTQIPEEKKSNSLLDMIPGVKSR